MIEGVRDHIEDISKAQKDQFKSNASTLEGKISSLEQIIKNMTADLKKLQSHANDTSSTLQMIKQKLADWDQQIQTQNDNLKNMQAALQTLMEAFQVKMDIPSSLGSNPKSYKVKNGDTLEKIAKAHGTTIQAIKDLNNLKTDRIVVGKTLQLP